MKNKNVINNPWADLRSFTDARIALGRAGTSIPTQHWLEFQLAHAQAQDAVHSSLNVQQLQQELTSLKQVADVICLHSLAQDRAEYLQRPDLGRRLNEESLSRLQTYTSSHQQEFDLAIVIADGLSSHAIQVNTLPFLNQLLAGLSTDWKLAPLCIVEQGRVAIGDDIGQQLNAKSVLVLIGERPGLSSPDSLGVYMTWAPEVGLSDANRNCLSNIRPGGLNYEAAAHKALFLLNESRRLKISGVNLKEDAQTDIDAHTSEEVGNGIANFLIDERKDKK